jgi:hypothetical protein
MGFVALVAAALVSQLGPAKVTIPSCFQRAAAPDEIVLACGDGNFSLESLRWRRWGTASASAVGVVHVNACKPYCAAGRFHDYPVAVTASRISTCHGGRRQYTRVAWRYTGRAPAGPSADAMTLGCRWPRA